MALPWQILLILLLICCSAFFSASETALFSLNRLRLKRRAEKNPTENWFIHRLLEEPRRLLQTILFGNELVNTAISVLAASFIFDLFENSLPTGLTLILPALLVLPVLLLCGEIVPKALAVRMPEFVAKLTAPLLYLFRTIIKPLQGLIDPFVSWFVRLIWRTPQEIRFDATSTLDEETLRSMVEIGHSEGEVHDSERRLIHRVLELDGTTVQKLMTKRDRVMAFEVRTPLEDAIAQIRQRRFSRIPVYHGSIERISGVLYTKDLLRLFRNQKLELSTMLRPAYFVPQTYKVSDLMRDFQEHQFHIALVVDEYGRFAGLITLQDILEYLFRDAFSERFPVTVANPEAKPEVSKP